MNIVVWGLGYVGTVTAACLANLGHSVAGIDSDIGKVGSIQAGASPVEEPGLTDLIRSLVASGALRATADGESAMASADISIICVGTPSDETGQLKIDAVERVAAQIGEYLRTMTIRHTILLRSTMSPGATRGRILPVLEHTSGKSNGRDFDLIFNPEFLREATAIADFAAPPFTVLGILGDRVPPAAEDLYSGLEAPLHCVAAEEAELLKVSCNAFHALKVGFANEVGRLSQALGVDAKNVMRLLCSDTKLNISPLYLKPGFAFGGSCLPKDIRSINATASQFATRLPILGSILESNHEHILNGYRAVQAHNPRRVAILGLGFKPNTNDVRESPVLELIRLLRDGGTNVAVYDPDIRIAELTGANRAYLEAHMPAPESVMRRSAPEALEGADCVVLTQRRPAFREAAEEFTAANPHASVVDLT